MKKEKLNGKLQFDNPLELLRSLIELTTSNLQDTSKFSNCSKWWWIYDCISKNTPKMIFFFDKEHRLKDINQVAIKWCPNSIGKHANDLVFSAAYNKYFPLNTSLKQVFVLQQQMVWMIIEASKKMKLTSSIETKHVFQTLQAGEKKVFEITMSFKIFRDNKGNFLGTELQLSKEETSKYDDSHFLGNGGIISPSPQELLQIYGEEIIRKTMLRGDTEILENSDHPLILEYLHPVILEYLHPVIWEHPNDSSLNLIAYAI